MQCVHARYTQRDPKASPLFQLVLEHYPDLKEVYRERFEDTYGPWQPHWDSIVAGFLRCGDLHYGFARVWCFTCKETLLVPFTCSARAFCPSCEAKRRALWAEHVTEHVLPPNVAYAMIVFTIPKCLRRIFLRERELLGDFARVAYDSTRRFLCEQFPGVEGKPYFVTSLHTWGDMGQIHPHVHSISSLGITDTDGVFHAVPEDLDFSPLEEMFRHALLAMLRDKQRITEETQRRLLSWRHSGFSANASCRAAAGESEGLHRMACYALRPPVSLQRLTYRSGSPVVVYQGTRYNPSTKSNFLTLDAKEFLVRLLCHVPKKRECLIRYCGAAASTERRGQTVPQEPVPSEESTFVKQRRSAWARLIHRVYGARPLTCPSCGSTMEVIAVIQDPEVIEKILRHLQIWDPPRGPPFEEPVTERVVEYDQVTGFPEEAE
jgi:hypothetical protein